MQPPPVPASSQERKDTIQTTHLPSSTTSPASSRPTQLGSLTGISKTNQHCADKGTASITATIPASSNERKEQQQQPPATSTMSPASSNPMQGSLTGISLTKQPCLETERKECVTIKQQL